MNQKSPHVYLLTNKPDGVIYLGVTSDLIKRIWQHKNSFVDGFSRRYNLHHLVWFEAHEDMVSAITREKNIKKWKRAWKVRLIEESNLEWRDLYEDIIG